jgi:environmental stress-induced protein Ves
MGCAYPRSIDADIALLTPTTLTDAAAKVLTLADYAVMRWKNGGGTTTEIARWPDSAQIEGELASPSFAWRVSIAGIAGSCAFSLFPGYERTLVLVRGTRMFLHIGRQPAIELVPYSICAFDGAASVRCALPDGPVEDFNVMVARGRAQAITEILYPGSAMVRHAIRGSAILLHCRDGAALVQMDDGRAFVLESGHTLRIDVCSASAEGFSLAAPGTNSPAVIAVHLTLLDAAPGAGPDSMEAGAP